MIREATSAVNAQLPQLGLPRTGDETIAQLEEQVDLACQNKATALSALQTKTGVKCAYMQVFIDLILLRYAELVQLSFTPAIACAKLRAWVIDHHDEIFNPLFCVPGLDPTQDTPLEPLHVILLGIVRYGWHMSTKDMTKEQLELFRLDLEALNTDGLSIPPLQAAYLIRYRSSLIGRQYKQLVPTVPLCIGKYVTAPYLTLWKAIGVLCALFWYTEIKNLDDYTVSFELSLSDLIININL
jgi:hypothetical protein